MDNRDFLKHLITDTLTVSKRLVTDIPKPQRELSLGTIKQAVISLERMADERLKSLKGEPLL